MIRVSVDPAAPEAAVARAAKVIAAGGVVAVPTDTLYGLAADPFNPQAVARVLEAKHRPTGQALALIASDEAQIAEHLAALPPLGRRLGASFWPGPLTLLVREPQGLAPEISAGTGRVGVRVPNHGLARRLCACCGRPLTATSANRSGEPAPADPDGVAGAVGDAVDLLLDAGRAPGGLPSTIVDVTGDVPRLVRAGAIAWDRIEACVTGR